MRRKSKGRTKEQQKAYREEQKRLKRPSRDDVARVALRWLIVSAFQRGPRFLDAAEEAILFELTEFGFDPAQAAGAIEDLVEKYTRGRWNFQRKHHLLVDREEIIPPVTS
ncbi:hypothetical protein [Rhizobium sp. Rhizsp82]|uniref:hypothetical protein n=1 Tax=Rhizobium sp. Rhizsp82 TaxID=3243057 RepID=UPI0039B3B446